MACSAASAQSAGAGARRAGAGAHGAGTARGRARVRAAPAPCGRTRCPAWPPVPRAGTFPPCPPACAFVPAGRQAPYASNSLAKKAQTVSSSRISSHREQKRVTFVRRRRVCRKPPKTSKPLTCDFVCVLRSYAQQTLKNYLFVPFERSTTAMAGASRMRGKGRTGEELDDLARKKAESPT